MWTNISEYQASVRRALGHDFEHIASSHGSWRSVQGGGKLTLAREYEWLLALSKLQALGLLGDFVRRHPGMFYRLVKEQIASRRGKA